MIRAISIAGIIGIAAIVGACSDYCPPKTVVHWPLDRKLCGQPAGHGDSYPECDPPRAVSYRSIVTPCKSKNPPWWCEADRERRQ